MHQLETIVKEPKRLNVKLDEEQMNRLNELFPRGLKSQLIRGLLDSLERCIEKHGYAAVGPIMQGEARLVFPRQDVSKFETPRDDGTASRSG